MNTMFTFRSSNRAAAPRVPEKTRVYTVGDIHGRLDLLELKLDRIDADLSRKPIAQSIEVYLGDYIDRGPSSRQVLDRLISRSKVRPMVFLKGNHETFITTFVNEPRILTSWQRLGGLETLLSYGLYSPINPDPHKQTALSAELAKVMHPTHQRFLEALRPSFTLGDFFFAHAGVRPGVPLADQKEDDLLWIRDEFLFYEREFGKVIVHGHTPVPQPEFRGNRINIDTGAYATNRLSCLVLDQDGMRLL